jgi:hypothetical protein
MKYKVVRQIIDEEKQVGKSPASVSFPAREAQTFPSAPSSRDNNRRNPRLSGQKSLQAPEVGNSTTIIDARAEPMDLDFSSV